jgi:hypothetical protein
MPESPYIDTIEPDRQHKRRIWQEHIERWQHSGLSQVAYCREYELKPHQFTYWKNRIVGTDTGLSFVPLRFSQNLPMAVAASTFNLFTPNGYRIEVGTGFDPLTLKQLISAVQSL